MKNILTALLLSVALVFTLSSCRSKTTDVAGISEYEDSNITLPGQLPIAKEKITLNLGVRDYRFVENYETNEYTKWLEEKTNIDLNFTLFPTANHLEKFRMLIASDSVMPDIIINFGLGEKELVKYGGDGYLIDQKELMENKGYYIKDMFKEARDTNLRKRMTTRDGAIYMMPYVIEQTGNDYGRKAFINQKWLNVLGLNMPETTEDLRNVLMAFKTRDPNGNGKADEIGFTGSKSGWNENVLPFLMCSFIYDDANNRLVVNNGKVEAAFVQNQWREGLKYIRDLAKDGLLDTQCFTQDSATLKTIAQNPDANLLSGFTSGSPESLFQTCNERLGEFVALPPMKGPEGVGYAIKSDGGICDGGIITSSCKNVLAAFRLMDFMMSEESALRSRYGVPGKDWEEAQPGDVCIFESIGAEPYVRSHLQYTAVQNSHWYGQNPQFRSFKVANGIVWNGNPVEGEYFKAKALDAYIGKEPKERVTLLNLSELETDEFIAIGTDIKSYVGESAARFIIGGLDLDKDWDNYLSKLKSMKVDRYVELAQIGYDNFNK